MKVSELRINNYVMLDDGCNDGEIIIITGTNAINGGHVYDEDDDIYGCDMIQPIPLTEQWLLDFGFDHMGIIFRKSVTHHLELAYMLSINEFRIQTKGNGFTNTLDIKHVHQLQNLYFALTGEELTIKEKV